jgi:hypothetical protein
MIGRSEQVLDKVLWTDAALEQVTADYNSVVLRVRESTGVVRTIRAEGYIGMNLHGFWDEVIIERAEVSRVHPTIDSCINSISQRFGERWPESGNKTRNSRKWLALIVHLSDGACLEVVAAALSVE